MFALFHLEKLTHTCHAMVETSMPDLVASKNIIASERLVHMIPTPIPHQSSAVSVDLAVCNFGNSAKPASLSISTEEMARQV